MGSIGVWGDAAVVREWACHVPVAADPSLDCSRGATRVVQVDGEHSVEFVVSDEADSDSHEGHVFCESSGWAGGFEWAHSWLVKDVKASAQEDPADTDDGQSERRVHDAQPDSRTNIDASESYLSIISLQFKGWC